jgi:hypothetical protein
MVLQALLRRQGIDSGLHLGVRKDSGPFEAHAWVEIDGVVVNDSEDVRIRYAAFANPISPGAGPGHGVGSHGDTACT